MSLFISQRRVRQRRARQAVEDAVAAWAGRPARDFEHVLLPLGSEADDVVIPSDTPEYGPQYRDDWKQQLFRARQIE